MNKISFPNILIKIKLSIKKYVKGSFRQFICCLIQLWHSFYVIKIAWWVSDLKNKVSFIDYLESSGFGEYSIFIITFKSQTIWFILNEFQNICINLQTFLFFIAFVLFFDNAMPLKPLKILSFVNLIMDSNF